MSAPLTELWSTRIWLGSTKPPLHQSRVDELLATPAASQQTLIPASTVIADQAAVVTQFLVSARTAGHSSASARDVTCQVELLAAGYSVGLAYGTGDWMGWCVLDAVNGVAGSSSGMLSLHDPRAGCAAVDVPGAPWGRPLTIKAEPGIAVVFPGWLGYSVTPIDTGHRILALTVAIKRVALDGPA